MIIAIITAFQILLSSCLLYEYMKCRLSDMRIQFLHGKEYLFFTLGCYLFIAINMWLNTDFLGWSEKKSLMIRYGIWYLLIEIITYYTLKRIGNINEKTEKRKIFIFTFIIWTINLIYTIFIQMIA